MDTAISKYPLARHLMSIEKGIITHLILYELVLPVNMYEYPGARPDDRCETRGVLSG